MAGNSKAEAPGGSTETALGPGRAINRGSGDQVSDFQSDGQNGNRCQKPDKQCQSGPLTTPIDHLITR